MGKDNSEKRDRCPNFTFKETELLISLVEQKVPALECKKTDALSNKIKETEWEKLTVKYNANVTEVRTTKMLRSKWESLKKNSRKELTMIKQCQLDVADDVANKIKKSPWTDRIACIIDVGASITFDNVHLANQEMNEEQRLKIDDQKYTYDNLHEESQELYEDVKWTHSVQEELQANPVGATEENATVSESSQESNSSISCKRSAYKRKRISFIMETNKKIALLMDSRIELLKTQIESAKKESASKMKMEAEKHELEIKILAVELKLKEKMLQNKQNES